MKRLRAAAVAFKRTQSGGASPPPNLFKETIWTGQTIPRNLKAPQTLESDTFVMGKTRVLTLSLATLSAAALQFGVASNSISLRLNMAASVRPGRTPAV